MSQTAANYSQQTGSTPEKKRRIANYWTKRSEDFTTLRHKELDSYMADRWKDEILPKIPKGADLKVLDVGTGSGFFAFLLEKCGYQVTGIDLTAAMVEEARNWAREIGSRAEFFVMDAEELLFKDEVFDIIVTRNLTWTLPNPQRAYREWMRVLKPEGVLLNFDGNYGAEGLQEKVELPENHAHKSIESSMIIENELIKSQLEISRHVRPAWDVEILQKTGFERLEIDFGVSRRVYRQIDEFFNPTPLFCIKAVKEL